VSHYKDKEWLGAVSRVACPEDTRRIQNMKQMRQMRQDIKAAKKVVTENGGDASSFPKNPARKVEPEHIKVCKISVPTFNNRWTKVQVPLREIEIPVSFGCDTGDSACATAVAACFEKEAREARQERQEKGLKKMESIFEQVQQRRQFMEEAEKLYRE
jgi:hypothetical protein